MAGNYKLTPEDKAFFDREGYVVVRGLLSEPELNVVKAAIDRPDGITKYAFEMADGQGLKSKLALFNYCGDDVTGAVCRLEKVVGTMAGLLNGDVFHYHTKLMMKEAYTGGAFVWHQDYGYWYNNGFQRPDMGTVMIALDRAMPENGALQVIPRSHLCGRINHVRVGEQTGADLQRVQDMLRGSGGYSVLQVPLEPGDAMFFHCNTLHMSTQNRSPHRRYCFLAAYCRVDNPALYVHHCPAAEPAVSRLPDDALLTMDPSIPVDPSVKRFMVPVTFEDDASLKSVTELWKPRQEGKEEERKV